MMLVAGICQPVGGDLSSSIGRCQTVSEEGREFAVGDLQRTGSPAGKAHSDHTLFISNPSLLGSLPSPSSTLHSTDPMP